MKPHLVKAADIAGARYVNVAGDPGKGGLLIGGTVLLIDAPFGDGHAWAALLADALGGRIEWKGET